MTEYNYVLVVFNEPNVDLLTEPKEVKILKEVTAGMVKGASCGPLNISFFPSDNTKQEISKILKDSGIKFLLVDEKDSEKSLPGYITRMFDDEFIRNHSHNFGEPNPRSTHSNTKKISLEDQLEEAVKNDDFEMAAKIRDKIANKKVKPEKAGTAFKDLFS